MHDISEVGGYAQYWGDWLWLYWLWWLN